MDATDIYLKLKAMSPEQRLEYIAEETRKFKQDISGVKKAGEDVLQAIKDTLSEKIEDYQDDYRDDYRDALLEDYWEIISDSDDFRKTLENYVRRIIWN